MKQLLLITLTIVFTSCNAQKTTIMKKFDIEKFNKNKNSLNRHIDTLDNGTIIEQTEYVDEYTETIKIKGDYIEKYRRYYKSGVISLEGEYFENDFQKGIWKEYNKKGNLIKETNYDKGYNYTWEDLLKLLKEREVNVKDTNNTTIRKDDGEWWIYYVKGLYIYNIRINGKTGKITLDDKDIFEEGS